MLGFVEVFHVECINQVRFSPTSKAKIAKGYFEHRSQTRDVFKIFVKGNVSPRVKMLFSPYIHYAYVFGLLEK